MEVTSIELKNVSYTIMDAERRRVLLNDIDYQFERGVISTIAGPSGSGKTTLLYAIAGLLNDVEGNILIGGKDINHMSSAERDAFRLKNISMVFQNLNLFSFMNVKDNILVPLRLQGTRITNTIEKKVDNYLELMNLEHIQNKSIQSLSGGEQQRVAIIRALISNPEVVLCDEPTASLDLENAKIFMDTLVSIKQETGATFIIVTHDSNIYEYGEVKLSMVNGKLVVKSS